MHGGGRGPKWSILGAQKRVWDHQDVKWYQCHIHIRICHNEIYRLSHIRVIYVEKYSTSMGECDKVVKRGGRSSGQTGSERGDHVRFMEPHGDIRNQHQN